VLSATISQLMPVY